MKEVNYVFKVLDDDDDDRQLAHFVDISLKKQKTTLVCNDLTLH